MPFRPLLSLCGGMPNGQHKVSANEDPGGVSCTVLPRLYFGDLMRAEPILQGAKLCRGDVSEKSLSVREEPSSCATASILLLQTRFQRAFMAVTEARFA